MRYDNQLPIFGEDGQTGISKSRVGIAGCGGIGVNVLTQLAEAGVTEFVICDGRTPRIEDLNTQFIYAPGDMRPKCVICAEWVLALNYTAVAEAHSEAIGTDTAGMFAGCNLIIDCLEDSEQSTALRDWCAVAAVPSVMARACGTKGTVAVSVPDNPVYAETAPCASAVGAFQAIVAGIASVEALKMLAGTFSEVAGSSLSIDCEQWSLTE